MNTKPLVTIIIPNYKTLQITKLCLRLIRKHTDINKIRVIVVDNDSQDESVAYLRSLKWIQLIERHSLPKTDSPVSQISKGMDLALAKVETPYILLMHTDTFILHNQWLDFLLKHIEGKPEVAGVGSWKLESKPLLRRIAKIIERKIQLGFFALINKKNHSIFGTKEKPYYLRSHCALYRMDLIKKYKLSFGGGEGTGIIMHKKLIALGYNTIFIPSEILSRYMTHANHASMVLNPEFSSQNKTNIKETKRITKLLSKINADKLLADEQFDY